MENLTLSPLSASAQCLGGKILLILATTTMAEEMENTGLPVTPLPLLVHGPGPGQLPNCQGAKWDVL